MSGHDEFLLSLPLVPLDQMAVEYSLTRAVEWRFAGGGDCDDPVIDGAGRTIMDGDCTTAAGVVFTGMAVVESGAEGDRSFDLDDFSVYASDGVDSLYFWGDGTLALGVDGTQTADLHYVYEGTGGEYPVASGEYIRHQVTMQDGFTINGKGYVQVIESSLWSAGELCFEADYSSDISVCSMEAVGTAKLTGDAVVEVTMDGDVACDSCIAMTVDGVDQGSVCP